MIRFYLLALCITISSLVIAQAPKGNADLLDFGRQNKSVKFYPNPATSVINFEFNKSVQPSYTIQLYTFGGKKVYEQTSLTPKVIVQLQDFFRGLYIYQLKDKSGKILESGKFQVSK